MIKVLPEGGMLRVDPVLLRRQALFSFMINFVAAAIFYTANFPNSRMIAVLVTLSGFIYVIFYAFFNFIRASAQRHFGTLMSAHGIVLLTFVIHLSGGLVSPLVFLYFCILISEVVHGLENSVSLPLSIISYSVVVFGELSGALVPAHPWAQAVYQSNSVVLVIALTTIAFMGMTRYIASLIVANLRGSLQRESDEKENLLKKFSELDSTAQIGSLAHRIAHDLRAPLSSISGYVQMELMKKHPADQTAELRDLDATVNSMAESLHCITRFGKVSQGPAERIQVAEFFRQLLAIAVFSPQARGVHFVKNYQAGLDACVCASRSDMQQAYFNIVKNALEATQDNAEGRVIEFSIRVVDKEVEVCVADNGPGIPPETMKNLFRKSITTKKDGTGVGLVITRDILARNDGYMELRNRDTGGLLVITRLPAA